MKLGVFFQNKQLESNPAYRSLRLELEAADCLFEEVGSILNPGIDVLLSVGGDGTFLSASRLAAGTGIPVLGVNLGRMGFLSEYRPENIAQPLLNGKFSIEERSMLEFGLSGESLSIEKPFALNEIAVSRFGAAMLGIEVILNGEPLPTYWADGLLVATSSGSTAYSLSVGGPICTPDANVFIISPIAPHNLNLRPLVVSSTSEVSLRFFSRDDKLKLNVDNRSFVISKDTIVEVKMARFSLKRVRLEKSNFIEALRSKLFWGEDFRNDIIQS